MSTFSSTVTRTDPPVRSPGFRLLSCLCLLIPLAGCNTLESVLREELALESETIDRVTFVVNDATAKSYQKVFETDAKTRVDKIDKAREEMESALEKWPKLAWDKYRVMVKDLLSGPITDATFKTVDAMGKRGQPAKRIAELKEAMVAAGLFPDQPGEWEKVLTALPTDRFLNYYMREKLALKIARQREINRLGGILKNANNPSREMDMIVKSLELRMNK